MKLGIVLMFVLLAQVQYVYVCSTGRKYHKTGECRQEFIFFHQKH